MTSNNRQFVNSNLRRPRPTSNVSDNILRQILDRLDQLEGTAPRRASDNSDARVPARVSNSSRELTIASRSRYAGGRQHRERRQGNHGGPQSARRGIAVPLRSSSRIPAVPPSDGEHFPPIRRDRPVAHVDQAARPSTSTLPRPSPRSVPTYSGNADPNFVASNNPNFRELVKTTTALGQIDQHFRNWTTVPESIGQNVEKLIANIRPPRPTEFLAATLEQAGERFINEIHSIVHGHLLETKLDVLEELSGVSRLDQTLANVICTRQLSKRLGSRLHLPTLTSSLHRLEDDVIDWERNRRARAPILTANRFSPIADLPDDPPMEDSPSPVRKQRHRLPMGISNAVLTTPTTRIVVNPTISCEPTFNAVVAARIIALETQPPHSVRTTRPTTRATTAAASSTRAPDDVTTRSAMAAASSTRTPNDVITDIVSQHSLPSAPAPSDGAVPSSSTTQEPVTGDLATAERSTSVTADEFLSKASAHIADSFATWRTSTPSSHHSVQIVGDSNTLMLASIAIPGDFNIDSFAGAKLSDTVRILETSLSENSPIKTVVIAVGINDRDNSPDRILSELQSLAGWRLKNEIDMVFLSVPIFDHFSKSQVDTIQYINQVASDLFAETFVICCERDQMCLNNMRNGGIHYDKKTAQVIMNNLIAFLS